MSRGAGAGGRAGVARSAQASRSRRGRPRHQDVVAVGVSALRQGRAADATGFRAQHQLTRPGSRPGRGRCSDLGAASWRGTTTSRSTRSASGWPTRREPGESGSRGGRSPMRAARQPSWPATQKPSSEPVVASRRGAGIWRASPGRSRWRRPTSEDRSRPARRPCGDARSHVRAGLGQRVVDQLRDMGRAPGDVRDRGARMHRGAER